ncbi:MAG: hypothetical protein HQL39_03450, partial [Alphaproteobacteria bacterium]|nr:hypothetical protein [Alphaproteobacteria bacterium]
MKRLIIAATLSLFVSGAAKAADEYEKVPAGDAQYKSCLAYSKKNYEGGDEKSKIAG